MTEQEKNLVAEIRGFGPDCRNCTRRLVDDYPYVEFPCKKVPLGYRGGLFFPIITSGNDSDKCEDFKPNLRTSLRNLIIQISPYLHSFQQRLPQ